MSPPRNPPFLRDGTPSTDQLAKSLSGVLRRVGPKAEKLRAEEAKRRAEQQRLAEMCGGQSNCIFISNTTLWNAYEANEVAADQRYRGKTIVISGVVDSVDKDLFDGILIHLRSPNQFMQTAVPLPKSQASDVAALKKGAQIEARCRVRGRLIGAPDLGDCVLLTYAR